MNMSSEWHHVLTFPQKRQGATLVGAFDGCAFSRVALRLRSSSSVVSSSAAVSDLGEAVLFRGQLRSSRRKGRDRLSLAFG
jgi:hypothetical protein